MSKTSIRWVIKFGGSLSRSAGLGPWLKSLAEHHCLIVPGGGPFADVVRKTQRQQGFDDTVAHDLAIRAMALYGRMLIGMEPRLCPVKTIEEVQGGSKGHSPLLWLPDPQEPLLRSLNASWDVTSDSIAAHLALALGIPELLLIKSVEKGSEPLSLRCATDQTLIDPALEGLTRGRALKLWFKGPNPEGLAKGLKDPVSSFTPLIP